MHINCYHFVACERPQDERKRALRFETNISIRLIYPAPNFRGRVLIRYKGLTKITYERRSISNKILFRQRDAHFCSSRVCRKFKIENLKEQMVSTALFEFLCGKRVFVNLPTGYGKSLIFQMASLVACELSSKLQHIHVGSASSLCKTLYDNFDSDRYLCIC